jgi:hypothetical protein
MASPGLADPFVRECVEALHGEDPAAVVARLAYVLLTEKMYENNFRSQRAKKAWRDLASALVAYNEAPLNRQGRLTPDGAPYPSHVADLV